MSKDKIVVKLHNSEGYGNILRIQGELLAAGYRVSLADILEPMLREIDAPTFIATFLAEKRRRK